MKFAIPLVRFECYFFPYSTKQNVQLELASQWTEAAGQLVYPGPCHIQFYLPEQIVISLLFGCVLLHFVVPMNTKEILNIYLTSYLLKIKTKGDSA
jgi:hypothetical protein